MANILLIEPDRLLAEAYFMALEDSGHHTIVCAGAQTAIITADQARPDLVILEIQLVKHSGIEFLYEFRSYEEWRDIPVLINSAVPPSEFANNWQLLKDELGVAEYYYKPQTSIKELLTAAQELLPIEA